jgi:hypothetical protein
MDILNFISWIRGKRVVTSVNASETLIPLGLKDPKRDDGYLAGAITVADFASGLVPPAPTYPDCNIPLGTDALDSLTSGSENIAIGCEAMKNTISGYANTAVGTNALRESQQSFNVAIGLAALRYNQQGGNNVAVGSGAIQNSTTSSANVGVGLYANTVYSQNTAVGYQAMSGNNNYGSSAFGYCALRNNQGLRNIAIGNSAMDAGNSAAGENIAIGNNSFNTLTTGTNNIGIGTYAMNLTNSGSNNIAIGAYATPVNFSNTVIIGNGAEATANNQFVVGSSAYNVGSVTSEVNTSSQVWNVRINGVNRKILLA